MDADVIWINHDTQHPRVIFIIIKFWIVFIFSLVVNVVFVIAMICMGYIVTHNCSCYICASNTGKMTSSYWIRAENVICGTEVIHRKLPLILQYILKIFALFSFPVVLFCSVYS